jgi:23S rRNA (pseudouridine1915-N3)-methyltransferase
MHLDIKAIGRMRGSDEAALVEDYLKRARIMGRTLGFSGPDLSEYDAPKGLAGPARKTKEAEWLIAQTGDAAIIALDENGKNLSSEEFAEMLGNWRDAGVKAAAFLIGGADGHAPSIIAAARQTVSFGRATWPHMLVRAMLTEQLYRAMTILSGHPYHRQ